MAAHRRKQNPFPHVHRRISRTLCISVLAGASVLSQAWAQDTGTATINDLIVDGKHRLEQNDLPGALQSFEQAYALSADDQQLQLDLGKLYEQAGRPADALRMYQQIVQSAPADSLQAKEAHVRSLMLAGTPAVTAPVQPETTAKQAAPDAEAAALLEEGKRLQAAGNLSGALQAYESALTKAPDHPETLYFAGNLYLELNQTEKGMKYLSRSADLDPGNYRLRLILAKAHERFTGPQAAIREYQEVLHLAPATPEAKEAASRIAALGGELPAPTEEVAALIAEGKRLVGEKDVPGALQIFQSALEKAPDTPEILYYVGSLSILNKQIDQGLAYLTRAIELAPNHFRLHLFLAKTYEGLANNDKAMHEYQEVLRLGPGTPAAAEAEGRMRTLSEVMELTAEGKKRVAANDAQGAMEVFKNALAKAPDNPELLYYVGSLAIQSNQVAEGVGYLARSVDLAPNNFRLRLFLGKTYEGLSDDANAQQQYQEVLRLGPGTPSAKEADERLAVLMERNRIAQERGRQANLIAEGKRRLGQGDFQGALQALEEAQKQAPDNSELLYLTGIAYLQLEQPDKGLKQLARSVELSPDNPALRLILARAYEQAGQLDKATREYLKIAQQAPATPEAREAEAHRQLLASDAASLVAEGRNRLAGRDFQGALQVFEIAMIKEPRNAQTLYFVGNLYLQMNQIDRGLKYLTRSVELAPKNPRLRIFLAKTYERLGRMDESIHEYQEIVRLDPKSPEGMEAEKHGRLLQGKLYLAQNKPDQARVTFSDLVNDHAQDQALLSDVMSVYLTSKRAADALRLLESVVSSNPDNLYAHTVLAEYYTKTNNPAKAIEQYEQIQRLTPAGTADARNVTLTLIRIKAFQALSTGAFTEAKELNEQILQLEPKDRAARLNLVNAYRGMKDTDHGKAILLEMIAQDPNDLEARIKLGTLYAEGKEFESSAREFEEVRIRGRGTQIAVQADEVLKNLYSLKDGATIKSAVEDRLLQDIRKETAENPDNLDAWNRLAIGAALTERRPDIIEAYENMARIKPDDARSLDILGQLYDEGNEFDKASKTYGQLLDLLQDPAAKKPVEEKINLLSAKQALMNKDTAGAETLLKKIVDVNPDHYLSHYYLALIYSGENKLEEAAHEYQEVLRVVPTHANSHLSLGLVYEQLRREEDALTEYRAALRLSLPPNLANTATASIKALEKRIDGFSYSLNYATSYDTNYNLTRDDPVEEFRTSLDGSVNYRYKLYHKSIYLGAVVSPSYITYHVNRFDIFSLGLTPYLTFNWRGLDYSTTYSHSESSQLGLDVDLNQSNSISGDVSGSLDLPTLLPWLAAEAQREHAPANWTFNLGVSNFESASSPIYDSNTYTFGGAINQSIGNGWRWSGNYNLAINDNVDTLGNDLAYVSNTVTLQLSKVVRPGISLNGGYSFALYNYTNPDSASLFTSKRRNITQSFTGSLNYFMTQELRLFASMAYRFNESNLATGLILSPEDSATAVGLQSSSLGDYSNLSIAGGVSFSF